MGPILWNEMLPTHSGLSQHAYVLNKQSFQENERLYVNFWILDMEEDTNWPLTGMWGYLPLI